MVVERQRFFLRIRSVWRFRGWTSPRCGSLILRLFFSSGHCVFDFYRNTFFPYFFIGCSATRSTARSFSTGKDFGRKHTCRDQRNDGVHGRSDTRDHTVYFAPSRMRRVWGSGPLLRRPNVIYVRQYFTPAKVNAT